MMKGRRLKKSLSQHLLFDRNILKKMVELMELSSDDTVLEVGAGRGYLTELLAQKAGKVFGVEIDRGFEPFLESLRERYKNLVIFYEDFLKIPLSSLETPLKIIGNIPYHITGPIIFKILKEKAYIQSAFFTIQKEVGLRIVAKPKTKAYGSLSILCQLLSEIKVHFHLKPHLFIPPPKVESLFLSMKFNKKKELDQGFFDFVRLCFQSRRKFLRYALSKRFDEKTLESLYNLMGFKASVRAEEIEPEKFEKMYFFLKDQLKVL